MKRYHTFLLVLCLCQSTCLHLKAQNLFAKRSIGITLSPHRSRIDGPHTNFPDPRLDPKLRQSPLNYTLGMELRHSISRSARWRFQTGIYYTYRRMSEPILVLDALGQAYEATKWRTFNDLEIPLIFRYQPQRRLPLDIALGVVPAFGIRGFWDTRVPSNPSMNKSVEGDYMNLPQRLHIHMGFAYSPQVAKNLRLSIEPFWQYDLNAMSSGREGYHCLGVRTTLLLSPNWLNRGQLDWREVRPQRKQKD